MKITSKCRAAGLLLLGLALLAGCATPVPVTPDAGATPQVAYQEPHRPQFHFTPPAMWMNDPNGLVFYQGEYHLFYQYYPEDTVWGPMHWGHAVSTDLVHWEHLPIALYPDEHGYIFSGSAVVDWNDSSGFGQNGEPPLVAIFTYHDPERARLETQDHETQGLAFSNDRGRTWTKYAGNPVLPNEAKNTDFRDPDVFWHAPSGQWIMTLSVHDHVEFWGSPNLKEWSYLSAFGQGLGAHGGVWECPDLFPLPVEGSGETRWVLIQNLNPGGPQGGSGTQYFVGDFDGAHFTLDSRFEASLEQDGPAWLDWGSDNYAGITWSDIPATDGRRIFIGWMNNWQYAQEVPTDPWRSAMTLPRSLHLVETAEGLRLYSRPVAELQRLRMAEFPIPRIKVDGRIPLAAPPVNSAPESGTPTVRPVADAPGGATTQSAMWSAGELVLEFSLPEGPADFGIELSNGRGERYRLGFNSMHDVFYSDRRQAGNHAFSAEFAVQVHGAPRPGSSSTVRMHLFLDTASIELFADDGATVLTDVYFPTAPFDRLALFSKGWPVQLTRGSAYPLHSIWNE